MPKSNLKAIAPTAMLLGITAIWGWTFLIVKDAIASYPVAGFLALRFVLAALLLAPFAIKGFSWKSMRIGLLIGIPLGLGYLFQTVGLKTTSAADAGLLTGLFVILTPVLDRVIYARAIARITLLCALMGLIGTALLTLTSGHGPGLGDLLEILTALAFALQIVWLGRYTSGLSPQQLAFGQMLPSAVMFSILFLSAGDSTLTWPTASVWVAIAITGILASALAFWVQTFVQQRMPAARAAILLLGEPAFAAGFAVWLGGERLGPLEWLGAVLIFGSLLLHEVWVATRPAANLLTG